MAPVFSRVSPSSDGHSYDAGFWFRTGKGGDEYVGFWDVTHGFASWPLRATALALVNGGFPRNDVCHRASTSRP
jgi:hypothetical protein